MAPPTGHFHHYVQIKINAYIVFQDLKKNARKCKENSERQLEINPSDAEATYI